MNEFNRLVYNQILTMDKLLGLQSELERFQKMEEELHSLQNETEADRIKSDINRMQKELNDIQETFEKQTEAVIQSYLQMETTTF